MIPVSDIDVAQYWHIGILAGGRYANIDIGILAYWLAEFSGELTHYAPQIVMGGLSRKSDLPICQYANIDIGILAYRYIGMLAYWHIGISAVGHSIRNLCDTYADCYINGTIT